MYVLAGVIAAAIAAYCSPSMRSKAQSAGIVAIWYGARACTEISAYGEATAAYVCDALGIDKNKASTGAVAVELVTVGNEEVGLCIRKFSDYDGRTHVAVGRSTAEVEQDREPCGYGLYGVTIRLREANGEARSFPVDFGEENYCLVGNVLFDPAFVAYWLQTRYGMLVDETDRWTTSFIGPGMAPVTVSDRQKCVCGEDGVEVGCLREEPAGAGGKVQGTRGPEREPWLLDLSGNPSP